jgi:glycosyltransferase involved in cell wall biosynthesis
MEGQQPQLIILVEAAGGVMRHVIDLYRGLRQRDIKVKIVLSPTRIDERYKGELSELDQSDIEYLPMKRWPHISDIRALFRIRKIIRQHSQHSTVILHAHSTKAGILGFFVRNLVAASIFTPHAYRGLDPKLHGLFRRFVEFVEGVYSKPYDRVIAEVPLEFAYALKLGISKSALRLIPNGIPIRTIDFDRLYEQRAHLSAMPALGFVGRLVYQKNPLLFIEVLHEIKCQGFNCKAIILGEGPLRAEMDQLAVKYGLADLIDWRGEVSATSAYPDMEIMVHTSLYEALPYSLIEACAALLPIIATSNPGSEEILRERLSENLVETPDAKLMAEKVIRLLKDRHLRLKQMESLKAIAMQYSTETMIERFLQQLQSLAIHATPKLKESHDPLPDK